MNSNLQNKQKIVDEIKEKIKAHKSLVFIKYQGTTVAQDNELRNEFRNNDCEYKIYKNTLLLKALNDLNMTGYDDMLKGSTSIAFGKDEIAPCQVVEKMKASNKNLEHKFGIIDGTFADANTVEKLGKLPSKEVLISQLLNMFNAPVRGLAVALSEIAKKA